MKLGSVAQITIGVPNLEESLAFYERLKFLRIDGGERPWPWVQLTDGQNIVQLNQDSRQYVGLNYFTVEIAQKVAAMETLGIQFVQKQENNGELFMAIFVNDDGLIVGLINQDASDMHKPSGEPLSLCGKFGELAVRVQDFTVAANFWQQLGFSSLFESEDPYPWGIFSDDMIVLGLHQTSDVGENELLEFVGPTMTYFAPDMPERINMIKELGLSFAQELPDDKGNLGNAVLQAPAGERIFLFQGEI